ncbi:MAG: hypothetical protein ACLFQ1_04220, partial [Halochromatium sp.]
MSEKKSGHDFMSQILKTQDLGMLSVKAVAVFLVVGTAYVILADDGSGDDQLSPATISANLAPVGRVQVEKAED